MSKVKHQERCTKQEVKNKDICSKMSYKVLAISVANVTGNLIIKIKSFCAARFNELEPYSQGVFVAN